MKIKTMDQTDRGTYILPHATWGEGNKILKKDGYYYLYHNECFGADHDRRALVWIRPVIDRDCFNRYFATPAV